MVSPRALSVRHARHASHVPGAGVVGRLVVSPRLRTARSPLRVRHVEVRNRCPQQRRRARTSVGIPDRLQYPDSACGSTLVSCRNRVGTAKPSLCGRDKTEARCTAQGAPLRNNLSHGMGVLRGILARCVVEYFPAASHEPGSACSVLDAAELAPVHSRGRWPWCRRELLRCPLSARTPLHFWVGRAIHHGRHDLGVAIGGDSSHGTQSVGRHEPRCLEWSVARLDDAPLWPGDVL